MRFYVQSVPSNNNIHQRRTDLSPVFFSLRTMDSKRKGLRVSFAFFRKFTNRTDEWRKQLLRLKNWMISGSPEQRMEFHRFWSTVVVFKSSFFWVVWFLLLTGANFLFFCKFTFPFLFFHDFEWDVKIIQQLLFKITFP